jgi:sporulation integral membrane protein YtvI
MRIIKDKFKSCPELLLVLIFVLGGAITVYLTNNYFSVFSPFIIAYLVTKILRPLTIFIKRKTKLPNIINTLTCLILFAVIVGLIIWLCCHYLVDGVAYLIELLSSKSTISAIINAAENIGTKFGTIMTFINVNMGVEDLSGVIMDVAKKAIATLSSLSINIAMRIPTILTAFIIGCIAAFYMLYDYDKISEKMKKHMSVKTEQFMDLFNNKVIWSLMKMIGSYILISAICFCELCVGFLILGIKDALFIAIIVALLDVLPVVGSGAVLVPWGVAMIAFRNPVQGIGLIILWIIIVIVRQIVEPKIVGTQLGLHPLITIIALYVGLGLMGGVGLVVGPLYVIVWKAMIDNGIVPLPNSKNKDLDKQQDRPAQQS